MSEKGQHITTGSDASSPRQPQHSENSPEPSSNMTAARTFTMTQEEQDVAAAAARFGYGPFARVSAHPGPYVPAFGGEMQPGLMPAAAYSKRRIGNPAPLGLCAFALTTFVLSLINLQTRGVTAPNIVVASAYGYGGIVQLLSGMWEMAAGNTFGATALSSYGGFWLSYAITLTPGGFQIVDSVTSSNGTSALNNAQGFWLIGWFIFTTIMCFLTIRSTVAFFSLFFLLDMTFLLLAIGHFIQNDDGSPTVAIIKAGGVFGLLAAFAAWYNAFAGIADDSNSFFIAPVARFPWSASAKIEKEKTPREQV